MVRVYSYVIDHDVGFAPNPFHGVCTLAACKPQIRRTAKVGDYIVGTGSKPSGYAGRLVYWMRVGEITNFNEYWNNVRFASKKPQMNGSLMQQHGDNIYRQRPEDKGWLQVDSFHSKADGSQCPNNTKRDTGTTDRVLIADRFAYWGAGGPAIPSGLSDLVHPTQGHRCCFPEDRVAAFTAWLSSLPQPEMIGRPIHWPTAA